MGKSGEHRAASVSPPTLDDAEPPTLQDDERTLLQLWRALDDTTRRDTLELLQRLAGTTPLPRAY